MLHDPLAQRVGRPVEQHHVDAVPGGGREMGESHRDPYPQVAVQTRGPRGVGTVRERGAIGQNGDVQVAVGVAVGL